MSIRNAAKAIVIKDGKILLNKCRDEDNGDYYTLPGGGQNQYETLHEALIRECLEETGYTVIPVRLAALSEEISMSEEYRDKYSNYTHKIYYFFICKLSDVEAKEPTEKDSSQINSQWIDVDSLQHVRTLPNLLGKYVNGILDNTVPVYLGSEYIDN